MERTEKKKKEGRRVVGEIFSPSGRESVVNVVGYGLPKEKVLIKRETIFAWVVFR